MSNHWSNRAACHGMDTDAWFSEQPVVINAAKRVCGHCPVREECLEEALATKQLGVWGGTTETERVAIVRSRRPQRTHCKRGHEYTPENTYWRPDGALTCRACDRSRKRRRNPNPTRRCLPASTHCQRGHEWTEENTIYHPIYGHRQCRACKRARDRRYARKVRAAA